MGRVSGPVKEFKVKAGSSSETEAVCLSLAVPPDEVTVRDTATAGAMMWGFA